VAEVGGKLIPFEVKYGESTVNVANLKGLRMLCDQKKISRAYVITRDMADFEVCKISTKAHSADNAAGGTSILKIPAPLACYWLSQLEHSKAAGVDG
ncbi:MAG: ATP-binding protein, partial [Planctomycetes bacterium]|nr:ATP-binding protein [Planctomycetota bacterium]